MTYAECLTVDVFVLLLCSAGLVRYGRLSHSHPATIYLLFHAFTFTWRLYSLMNGADTLFSNNGPTFHPVTEDEIARAAILADVSLMAVTVACLIAARRTETVTEDIDLGLVPTLNSRVIWTVVILAMPLGVWGLLTHAVVPETVINPRLAGAGVSGQWGGSSYLAILPTWPGLLLLILIYYHGFRRWLMAPMGLYLAIMAIQGYHRFRVIIPIILLLQMYLDRRGRRWPGLMGVALLAALGIAFFPLKVAGRMVQDGASIAEIAQVSADMVTEAREGQAGDQQFLDQFACSLTLVDNTGTHAYGKQFLSILTLPIPREIWPGKPGLADHIIDISTPDRPMGEMGMILTYIGDAYANFGYAGVILFPLAIGYALTRAYAAAYMRPYASVFRFSYLMMACNFIEVYRDGIASVVIFTAVQMMPLTIIVGLHRWFARTDAGTVAAGAEPVIESAAEPRALRG